MQSAGLTRGRLTTSVGLEQDEEWRAVAVHVIVTPEKMGLTTDMNAWRVRRSSFLVRNIF